MGSYYKVLGAKIPSWVLSLGTITTVVGAATLSGSGNKEESKKEAPTAPAAANSKDDIDVEKLLNNFLEDNEDKKAT